MSVFVKGMKMPKGCHSGCPLTDSDAFTCQITGKDIVIYDEDTITSRPSWCPLVEVPTSHGRLIDADAFKKENERLLHCDFPYLYEATLEELIDEAPTVIEAEE